MYSRSVTALLTMLSLFQASVVCGEDVLGVLGMNPVTDNSYIAVWIPLAEGESLAGIEWFNNDGTSVFQAVLITAGDDTTPGYAADAMTVMADVYGLNYGWSRVDLNSTYTSNMGGVYVMLHLQFGSVFVSQGAGGGSAIGYVISETGNEGWMTADGQDWCALHPTYGFALRAITRPVDPLTVTLTRAEKVLIGGRDPGELASTASTHLVTAMTAPVPNPFNPQTQLHFTLASAERVDLSLYDLQGGLVNTLASGMYSVGDHLVVWDGRDDQGRSVPSGTYLAYLRAGRYVQTQRMVLLR